MIIGTKSCMDKNQVEERKRKGASFMELYTKLDDIPVLDKIGGKKFKNYLNKLNMKCYAVHSLPWYCIGNADENTANRKEIMNTFERMLDFTNEACDIEKPVFIIHPDVWIKAGERVNIKKHSSIIKNIENEIYDIVEYMAKKNYDIKIGVENMPAIAFKEGVLVTSVFSRDGDLPYFIKSLKIPCIGTVFDLSHATNVVRFQDIYFADKVEGDHRTLISIMKEYMDTLCLIHFVKAVNLGTVSEEEAHYLSIENKDDIEYSKTILSMLKDYKYDGYITLELYEKDYSNAVNYERTRKVIEYTKGDINTVF